jgi:hypothetical protein
VWINSSKLSIHPIFFELIYLSTAGHSFAELDIIEAFSAIVNEGETAVITVYGSDYIEKCKFENQEGET